MYGQKEEGNTKSVRIERRMSTSGKLENTKKNIPRPTIKRRMSQPITQVEKIGAVNNIQRNEIRRTTTEEVKREVKSLDPRYDTIGIYPPVKRLIAMGDVHGDLRVTLLALKLAEVIPQNSDEKNVDSIHWCGG